ncbi:MopE-related protein [Melittangium boletus]|uniref:MopE-related protein n=1 Tax=Melittangium boletus TaxID=83453 RepID=UPI003DA4448B
MSPRSLLVVSLLALVAAGCRDKGAVQLTVAFPEFKPGCVRVSIQDANGTGTERVKDVKDELAAKSAGGRLTVGAWREAGWSTSVRVTALAYERGCEGTPVETQSTTVTVEDGRIVKTTLSLTARDADGDGYVTAAMRGTDCDDTQATVNPGQPELCNGQDDNCDGTRDEGYNVGQSCTNASQCGGAIACTATGGAECKVTQATYRLYLDQDGDGYGTGPAVESCTSTRDGYAQQDGDCDDTQAKVKPSAEELCDGQDNNCDGTTDEGYGLEETCAQLNGCRQKKACTSERAAQCVYVDPPTTYYPDDDLDSYGRDDGSVKTCLAPVEGYITRGGDCNDGNRFTFPGADELCDLEDNNCNDIADEGGVCPMGGPTWKDESSSGGAMDVWRSVSLWNDGQGVWVVGGSKYELRAPGQASFSIPAGKCSGTLDLNVVWASLQGGDGLFAGANGFIGGHAVGGACLQNSGNHATGTNVQGFTEVRLSDGSLEAHFGGTTSSAGRMFWSNKTSNLGQQDVDKPVYDVHGLSREVLFAVGGNEPNFLGLSGEARIYRYTAGAQPWTKETLQSTGTLPLVNNRLRAVWVVNPRLAYAVGDGGSVLIWNGTSWNTHKSPTSEDLLSVVAFGKRSIYVTSSAGRIYRYGRNDTWTQVHQVNPGKPLNDIAGNHPGNLWVVGEQGRRLHWPQ